MNLPLSNPLHDTVRTLWLIRNTWDPHWRRIVRQLIRSDIRKLRLQG
jgi:hypothetical protein